MLRQFLRPFLRDRFLHLLLLIGLIVSFFVPFAPAHWPDAIDWHTIITLSGLMMLTKGVELSGYFDVLGRRMVKGFASERQLAMFMVFGAALLSTFLTNDVALFIVVPLTITLKKLCGIPITRLIIFEALAVNAGSLLTPIGNPQNILLWGRSGISFAAFIWQMLPLAAVLVLSLLVLCWFFFPAKALRYQAREQQHQWKPRLVWSCLVLYLVFLASLEFHLERWGLLIVAAGFVIMARNVLVNIDWSLLLVFIVMFIDVHLLIQLPVLRDNLPGVTQLSSGGLFLLGVGLTLVLSNVPSTVLGQNCEQPSVLAAGAVNIGGFGLLPGSLANLIALRMAGDRRIWWRFHLWSLPLLAWGMLVGWGLLTLLR